MKARRKHTKIAPPTKKRRLCPPDWEGMVEHLGMNVVENPDWLVGAD